MSRHYFFTYHLTEGEEWGLEEDEKNIWFNLINAREPEQVKYLKYQLEKGENSEGLHFQGYVRFNKVCKWPMANQILGLKGHTHYENPRNVRNCIEYVGKEESRIAGPWEIGTPSYQEQRTDLDEAAKLAKEGKMQEIEAHTYVKFHRGLNAYAALHAEKRNWATEVYIYWGETGTGKSKRAHEELPNACWKPPGEWFDGYQPGMDMIIDDFNPEDMKIDTLLRLMDRYPLQVPIKGGFVNFNAKKLIITSHWNPENWYAGRWPEIKRRCKQIVHFETPVTLDDLYQN